MFLIYNLLNYKLIMPGNDIYWISKPGFKLISEMDVSMNINTDFDIMYEKFFEDYGLIADCTPEIPGDVSEK